MDHPVIRMFEMGKRLPSPRNPVMPIKLFLRCLILILPFVVAGHNAFTQVRYHFYYGRVLERGAKTGIPGVNLSVENSRFGTVSDETGSFSFFVDTIPAILRVSHIGYETRIILLDETSYSLLLYLGKKATMLEEVEITASRHEPFFRDDRYAVLDYEIDSSLVYLLIFRQTLSKMELICKDLNGDTVATSARFSFRPDRLFTDCLGNLHLLSHDSGFQVYRDGNRLHLIHPVRLKKYKDILKDCVAATPGVLYFRRETNHGLGAEYFGLDRITSVKTPITRVTDEKLLKMLRRNPEDAMMMGSPVQPDSREAFVTWNYTRKILYRPVKTSLHMVGENICIFNTPDQQMEFYDEEGRFLYKLALKTGRVKDGRWTKEILPDAVTGKVFTTFVSNGRYALYEINLDDGSLKKRLTLFHFFPEKIRVHRSAAYYLYDDPTDPDNKVLFRQNF